MHELIAKWRLDAHQRAAKDFACHARKHQLDIDVLERCAGALEMALAKLAGFWCIQDPDGYLVHTTLNVEKAGAIREHVETETFPQMSLRAGALNDAQIRCLWREMERDGYLAVPVALIPKHKPKGA